MTDPERRNERVPTIQQSLLLFMAAVALAIGAALAFDTLELSLTAELLLHPLLYVTLLGLALAVTKVSPRDSLLLKLPSRMDLLAAVPLAAALFVLSDQLSNIVNELGLVPPELQEEVAKVIRAETAGEWVVKLLGIGILAPLWEELFFRGFLLTPTRRLNPRFAVIFTSLLFAMMHGLPLPSYALAGIALGVAALGSGSILVPLVIHCVNNIAAVALFNLAEVTTFGEPLWTPPGILIPALVLFFVTTGYYWRKVALPAPEPAKKIDGRLPEPPATERGGDTSIPALRGRPLQEELAAVPIRRRRLGYLIAALAALFGTVVLVGLTAYILYMGSAQSNNAQLIERLKMDTLSRLSDEASARQAELEAAYDSLTVANRDGRLGFAELSRLSFGYYRAVWWDDRLDPDEVDELVSLIGRLLEPDGRGASTAVRKFRPT